MIISMIAMVIRSSSYPFFLQKYKLAMGIAKVGGYGGLDTKYYTPFH